MIAKHFVCVVVIQQTWRNDKAHCQVIGVIFIYIRLSSVKGCHSKGALITIQTQIKG